MFANLPKFMVFNMFIAKDDNIERIMDVKPRVRSPFSPFFLRTKRTYN